MSDVIVERRWQEPLVPADVARMFAAGEDCLGIHRIEWRGSLLSQDGRDLVCHFFAPDTESVRIAFRQMGSGSKHIYATTVHDAAGTSCGERRRANVLVSRRFDAPVDFADIQMLEDRGQGCLDLHRVRFMRSHFSSDRRRMLCLYEAPDAESVRIAQREAALPVERIYAFQRFDP
jgi:hypothetical protein